MADGFQKVIAVMFFIMLALFGALFCAAAFIVPIIAEGLADASEDQVQLPMPLERLMSLARLAVHSWPFLVVIYVTLITGLLWWCLALKRKS